MVKGNNRVRSCIFSLKLLTANSSTVGKNFSSQTDKPDESYMYYWDLRHY